MKSFRVLLISPPQGLHCGSVSRPRFQSHPLGLLYLAAVLAADDFDVQVCDALSFGYDADYIQQRITESGPDVIGLSAMTLLAPDCYAIAQRAKQLNPDAVTVMGGPHTTTMSGEALTEGHMDATVSGEGELSFLEICRKVRNGSRDFADIPGISYRSSGMTVDAPPRPPIMDLDSLPMPAYNLLAEMSEYNPPPHWGKKGRFASLITSRGCPYDCMFCSVTRTWGKRYRFRSTANILAELKWLYEDYQCRYFSFRDSTLTLHKPRVMKLCQAIIDAGMKIRWNCNARASEVTDELLKSMKNAGCESIQFGIESGDDEILRKFKNLDKKQIRNAVELTRRNGIKAHGYFMFGLPGETGETVAATIAFAKSLPLHSAGFTTVTPFPGSQLWDHCVDHDMITTTDWSRYNLKGGSVIRHPNFDSDQLRRIQKRAFMQFYLRPSVVWRHLSTIRSPNDMLNYIKEALINFT
jgi:radical SAM superfamily enzyme YgiQ (UPF0313 family)